MGLAALRGTWPHPFPGQHSFANTQQGWAVQGEGAQEGQGGLAGGCWGARPLAGLCALVSGQASLVRLLTCKGSRLDQIKSSDRRVAGNHPTTQHACL